MRGHGGIRGVSEALECLSLSVSICCYIVIDVHYLLQKEPIFLSILIQFVSVNEMQNVHVGDPAKIGYISAYIYTTRYSNRDKIEGMHGEEPLQLPRWHTDREWKRTVRRKEDDTNRKVSSISARCRPARTYILRAPGNERLSFSRMYWNPRPGPLGTTTKNKASSPLHPIFRLACIC